MTPKITGGQQKPCLKGFGQNVAHGSAPRIPNPKDIKIFPHSGGSTPGAAIAPHGGGQVGPHGGQGGDVRPHDGRGGGMQPHGGGDVRPHDGRGGGMQLHGGGEVRPHDGRGDARTPDRRDGAKPHSGGALAGSIWTQGRTMNHGNLVINSVVKANTGRANSQFLNSERDDFNAVNKLGTDYSNYLGTFGGIC